VRYLLDTNVISEARKGARAAPAVIAWLAQAPAASLWTSVVVLGEIRRGIEGTRRRDPDTAAVLDAWLNDQRARHAGRVLPIDEAVADLWGRLSVPDPLPTVDGLLAATAMVHGMTLVTRNTKDVARTGVRLFNPFLPSP
jgi:predicted nucleic acid-binding protein